LFCKKLLPYQRRQLYCLRQGLAAYLAMAVNEPTHGDILVQIGELKGQVATLITLVGEKRDDINAAFTRIGVLEKSAVSRDELTAAENKISNVEKDIAKWTGICLALTFSLPFVAPYITKALTHTESHSINKSAP